MPSTTLFLGDGADLGAFRCRPGDDAWGRVNTQCFGHVMAFPGTPVWIQYPGEQPIVGDRNQVMYYARGQDYRRRMLSPEGDRCLYIGFGDALAREVLAEFDPRAAQANTIRFPVSHARLDARTYLEVRVAARAATAPDPLRLNEALYGIVRNGLAAAYPDRAPVARTDAGVRARLDLVEAAKALLATPHAQRWSLSRIGKSVHASPYHLTRVFRAVTGVPLHRYLNQMRLRAAVEPVLDGEDLSCLAYRLGFASHAHFTTAFTAAFGVAPSQARRRLHGARAADRASF